MQEQTQTYSREEGGQSLWWKSLTAQPTRKMVIHPSIVVVHQQWLCFTRKIPRKTLSLAQGDGATVVVPGENVHRVIAAIMDEVLLDWYKGRSQLIPMLF
jgi:hypothetical protein